jgi:hypothetical protein
MKMISGSDWFSTRSLVIAQASGEFWLEIEFFLISGKNYKELVQECVGFRFCGLGRGPVQRFASQGDIFKCKWDHSS